MRMIRNILRHQYISRQDIGDRRCGFAFDSMCYMPVDQVFVKSVCDALGIQRQSRISLISSIGQHAYVCRKQKNHIV